MSMEPSPIDWPNRGRPADDPDGLLRAFFRAELPSPWPGFRRPERPAAGASVNGKAPDPGRAPRLGRLRLGPVQRSRLALAAAVALLLIGTLLLSGRFQPVVPDSSIGPPYADPDLIPKVIIKESLIQEVDELPGPDGQPIRQEQPTKYLINIQYAP